MSNTDGEDIQPKRQPSFYRSPSNDYKEGYRDGTKELASLRDQLDNQKDRCIDLFEKVSEIEEVIRELMLVAEGYIYYYRNVHPNDEFGKIKDVNSLIEKAKSLTTKDK